MAQHPTISKMKTTQTAVEWFFDKLKNHEIQAEHFELYQQAKQMEKKQREQLFNNIIEKLGTYLANDTKPTLDDFINQTTIK